MVTSLIIIDVIYSLFWPLFWMVLLLIFVLAFGKSTFYYSPCSFLAPAREPLIGMIKDTRIDHIHAWHVKRNGANQEQSKQVVLFCHGNANNISGRQEKIVKLVELGYDVFIFDYSGYGQSYKSPSERQFYKDGNICFAYLYKLYGRKNIIPYGESMGGAVASWLARKYDSPILILESCLPVMWKVVPFFLRWMRWHFYEFNTEEHLKNYKGKLLVIQSHVDCVTTWRATAELRKKATRVIEYDGFHCAPNFNWDKVGEFLFEHTN